MARRLLTCPRCGAKFANGGVFVTCEKCRRGFTEDEKRQQGGCKHWQDVSTEADRRVTRVKRDNETF